MESSLGLSTPLASVLPRSQRVFAAVDALAHDTLRNINALALSGEKEAMHHVVLSVSSQPCHAGGSLYQLVTFDTLVLDIGILFPLPPAMGAIARLVRVTKVALEEIDEDTKMD